MRMERTPLDLALLPKGSPFVSEIGCFGVGDRFWHHLLRMEGGLGCVRIDRNVRLKIPIKYYLPQCPAWDYYICTYNTYFALAPTLGMYVTWASPA